METRARRLLQPSAAAPDDLLITRTADMRYVGQGFEINVPMPDGVLGPSYKDQIRDAFVTTYQSVFGRVIRDGTPEFINWRLSASRPATAINVAGRPAQVTPGRRQRPVRFAGLGAIDVDVYDRYALAPGTTIAGPALIEELETSCGVGPDCTVTIDSHHNLIIDIDTPGTLRNHLMTAADIADIESLTGWDTPEAIRVDEQNVVGWSRSADFSVTELLQLRRVRH